MQKIMLIGYYLLCSRNIFISRKLSLLSSVAIFLKSIFFSRDKCVSKYISQCLINLNFDVPNVLDKF